MLEMPPKRQTHTPSIKPGQVFELMGTGFYDMGGKKAFEEMTLQVDSKMVILCRLI